MDIEKIISTLEILSERKQFDLITPSDIITLEVAEILKQFNSATVSKIFMPTNIEDKVKFKIEVKCSSCGRVEVMHLSKTKVLGILFPPKQFAEKVLCDACKCALEQQKEKKLISNRVIQKEKTEIYIDKYLKPTDNTYYPKHTVLRINSFDYGDDGCRKIVHTCKEMSYKDYLKTPYWKGVAGYKKYKSKNKCQLCGCTERLEVHHRDYSIRGQELDNMNDLICLCHDCHAKFHDKL